MKTLTYYKSDNAGNLTKDDAFERKAHRLATCYIAYIEAQARCICTDKEGDWQKQCMAADKLIRAHNRLHDTNLDDNALWQTNLLVKASLLAYRYGLTV